MKKALGLLLALTLTFGAGGCKHDGGGGSSADPSEAADYYETYAERATVDLYSDDGFTEDFSNGLGDELWRVVDGAWHNDQTGAEHDGVKPANVSLVEENGNKYLALAGKGRYYREDKTTGRPEGAAIISRKAYGPGRYEIRMKALPREGAVSTMWTYMTSGSEADMQHEIDIELGGTTEGTQFRNAWFTTWTTHTDKESHAIDVSDDLYLNDGEWHLYTFDWYTDYNGTGEGRIDYFIDGKFYVALTDIVPDNEMPIWVGVWFPPLWAGNAEFEKDYMYVDMISHVPFDQYRGSVRYNAPYNLRAPSSLNIPVMQGAPVAERLANGSFKYEASGAPLAWTRNEMSSGGGRIANEKLELDAAGTPTYYYQTVTNVFDGYTFDFTADIDLSEGDGYAMARFVNMAGKVTTVNITPENGKLAKEISAPADFVKLEIYLVANSGTVRFDNASLIFKGRQ